MSDTKARAKVKRFYVYIHCRPDGTPFYVGKGTRSSRSREFVCGRNQHHKNIVAKHGKENIKIYVRYCDSEAQAFEHEIWLIAYGRTHGWTLVNVTDGGEGQSGYIVSPEGRANMSAAHTGVALSIEHIARRTAGQTGLHRTAKTCANISASLMNNQNCLGRIDSLDTRAKKSASNMGKNIGNKNWMGTR